MILLLERVILNLCFKIKESKKPMYVDMLIKNITPKECVIIVTIKKVEPENLGFVNMKFIMLKGFARIVI